MNIKDIEKVDPKTLQLNDIVFIDRGGDRLAGELAQVTCVDGDDFWLRYLDGYEAKRSTLNKMYNYLLIRRG